MDANEIIVKYIDDTATVFQPTGKDINIVNRPFCALSCSFGGKITYTHKGKKYFSDENCIVFHPYNSSYNLKCTHGGKFCVINFLTNNDFDEFAVFPIVNQQTSTLFKELENLFFNGSSTAKKMSVLYEIFGTISPKKENFALNNAIRLVENEYARANLSISELAEACGMCDSYFRRIFLSSFGISPKKYLLKIRIEKAKRMLLSADKSVSEVAERCGFASVYHFCRAFKTCTNETPGTYAKNNEYKM